MRLIYKILFLNILLGQGLDAEFPGIELSLELDRQSYPVLTESQFYIRATIETRRDLADDNQSAPLNLCIALDCSGSMAGERLKRTKEALIRLMSLLSSEDTFSLVAFGSQTETPIPAQRVDRLENAAIDFAALESKGGTALYDALNQAAAQLRRYRSANTVNRILLISDGPPTRGPREPEDFATLARAFATERIAINAIGIGSEYDADLLQSLARLTSGTYQSSSSDRIFDTIKTEIDNPKQAIARDAELAIEFRSRVELEDPLDIRAETKSSTVYFRWDQLYGNQKLSAIVSGRILAYGADNPYGNLAEATLRFTPAGHTGEQTVAISNRVEARFTDSRRHSIDSIDPSVLRAALAAEIANSVLQAFDFYDEGSSSKAERELRRSLQGLKSINSELDDPVISDQLQALQVIYDQQKSRGTDLIGNAVLSDEAQGTSDRIDPPATAR